jgi:hypothetical protein
MWSGGMSLAGLLVLLTAAPAPPVAGPPKAPNAAGSMQLRQLDERAWEAETRDKLAARLKIAPEDLRFSPGKRLVAWVVGPPPPPAQPTHPPKRRARRPPPPPRFHIFVADVLGKLQAGFKPVNVPGGIEGPKDLRFLDDDRLVYEVVLPAPDSAPKPAPHKKAKAHKAPAVAAAPARPAADRRMLVIQPVAKRARPIRCEGFGFAFSPQKNRLAFVSGDPATAVVNIDGKKLYPRRARTAIVADPAWSPDGAAIALVEAAPGLAPRLVLVPDFDDASSDTTWDLPPTTALEGLHVFWAGPDKLVVGKTATSPVFATSFELQRPTN